MNHVLLICPSDGEMQVPVQSRYILGFLTQAVKDQSKEDARSERCGRSRGNMLIDHTVCTPSSCCHHDQIFSPGSRLTLFMLCPPNDAKFLTERTLVVGFKAFSHQPAVVNHRARAKETLLVDCDLDSGVSIGEHRLQRIGDDSQGLNMSKATPASCMRCEIRFYACNYTSEIIGDDRQGQTGVGAS